MSEKKQVKKEPAKAGKQKPAKETVKSVAEEKIKEIKVPCRLKEHYNKEIAGLMRKTFSYKSVMQVPKLHKIVVNMGVGSAVADPKVIEEATKDLEAITGQKSSTKKAKKAISNFKLRQGMSIGVMVTLRNEKMYEFLDRLINVAMPRIRDFRGLSDKSFDGRGNYTMGIKEQIIFPEINIDKVTKILGMDITFVTTANSDNEAYELLHAFGFPFRKKEIK